MTFNSAVDSWFYVLGIAVPALILVFVLITAGSGSLDVLLTLSVVSVLTLGLPVWILLSTFYVVTEKEVKVQSGPFHWSISLHEISSIESSRSLLSSPALSLNRLEIRYGNRKSLLLSPVDTEGFKQAVIKAKELYD